jgi:hypothetical protein
MAKGFVYVLSNPASPGLLKIGHSRFVPDARADELYTTGVPSPFVVEFYCLTESYANVEVDVHRSLSAQRHNASREFFNVSLADAVEAIKRACVPEHIWLRTPIAQAERKRPASVECSGCGASYVVATHCPKCRLKLIW